MDLPRNPHFDTSVRLYPFQRYGAFFLASQTAAMLGDEMGLGKTIQAIRAADYLSLRTGVVIAPVSAVYNWQREFKKFSWYDRKVVVMRASNKSIPEDADVVVISPGLLRNPVLVKRICKRQWDFVIVDEADDFRNGERLAKQTKGLYGAKCDGAKPSVVAVCKHKWLLTGTPVRNHVGELWTHARALWSDAIKSKSNKPISYMAFLNRYAITRTTAFGLQVMGNNPARLAELREKILDPYVLRRTKKQARLELPPLHTHRTVLPVENLNERIEEIADDLPESVIEALESLDGDDPNAEAILRKIKAVEPSIARLLRVTGLIKVAPSSEMISSSLLAHPDRKAIVFAYHKDVIAGLEEAFAANGLETVTVTGSVTGRKRQAAIDAFQDDGGPRVFIGQLTACGTAITLTRAQDVYLVESAWTPAVNAQAIARAWRIGQHKPVVARFLTIEGSIDDLVVQVLLRKTRAIKELLR